MPEPSLTKLTRTRVFLLVFFGIALVLALSTIVASFQVWGENDAAGVSAPVPPRLQR